MNRKPQDSADELVEKLHRVLEKNKLDGENGGGTPEDVFSDRSVSQKDRAADEQIAAFDSYMADLLGGIVADGAPLQGDPTVENEPMLTVDELSDERSNEPSDEQALDLMAEEPHDVEELTLPEEVGAQGEDEPAVCEAVDDKDCPETWPEAASRLDEKHISMPDARAELSDEVQDGEETVAAVDGDVSASPEVEEGADEVEQPSNETISEDAQLPFEVLEQLTIGADASEKTADENENTQENTKSEEDALPGEIEEPEVLESLTESEVSAAEDADASETDGSEALLREGDLLLDADDDIPVASVDRTEQTSEEEHLELQGDHSVEQGSASPAASPLNAARESELQKQAEVQPPRPKQSPLDAMAAKSIGNVASFGGSAFPGRQSRERTLTDQDVELLLALGYDSNLVQKVGSQRVESVRYRCAENEATKKKLKGVYGCTGEEYSGHAQDKAILARYKKHQTRAIVKLVLAVLLALAALAVDLFPLLGDQLPKVLASTAVTAMYGVVGIMLIVLGAIVCWQSLAKGVRALMHFSPVPASVAALLLMFTLLYDISMLFDIQTDVLLNFPMAVTFVLLAAGELMNVLRQRMTFGVVSAHSRKIVMEPVPPRKKKVVRDGHIVKIIDDEAGQRAWSVHPTDQVTGYFRRSGEETPRYRGLSLLLVLGLVSALVLGVVTLIVTEQPKQAGTAFMMGLQLALPVSALISYAYPMLVCACCLTPRGCAIVGHRSVDEYAGDKMLVFDDTEMFRSKSSTEITIKGSGDAKKYIRYAKRLFATLGGTLRGISTSDLSEETYEERVEILKIFDQGVEACIDGKVHVLAGNSSFMMRHGVRVPDQSAELLVRRSVESSILYLAFDGKLRLGYEVDYRISGRFEQMAAQLSHCHTSVAIRTCDPCIYDDFLSRSRAAGAPPISVVKPVRFERHTESLVCDSGVIATRSARDIAVATMMCDALLDNDRHMHRFRYLSLAVGSALVLGLSLFGWLTYSATLIAALAQAVWCLPVLVLSRKNLMSEQLSENKHEH